MLLITHTNFISIALLQCIFSVVLGGFNVTLTAWNKSLVYQPVQSDVKNLFPKETQGKRTSYLFNIHEPRKQEQNKLFTSYTQLILIIFKSTVTRYCEVSLAMWRQGPVTQQCKRTAHPQHHTTQHIIRYEPM
jgi:hypothetical protein